MNVTCPQCATVFRVDPAKVPERGVRARCSVCAGLIAVRRPPVTELVSPKPPAPERTAEPSLVRTAEPWPAALLPRTPPAPLAVPFTPTPTPPPAPVAEPIRFAPPPPPKPPVSEPVRSASPTAPEPMARPNSPPAVTFSALPPETPAPGAPRIATPRSASPFTNPFLQQNPSTRARRLARALISDLVVYHPEKRQRGLADGNLKELFAEEIRKSWEEYSEQVGDEIASGTSYFTEALNEILSEGRQLFG